MLYSILIPNKVNAKAKINLFLTIMLINFLVQTYNVQKQCWTEGRSSTAVAEDLGPTATATVAEV